MRKMRVFTLFCTYAVITKLYLYNFDPLKLHFYIVKLGLTGYTLFFLFQLKNIDCGYALQLPRRGGIIEYPQSMFWAEIWKKISEFLSENFKSFLVKFSVYLNRRVFVLFYPGVCSQLKKSIVSNILFVGSERLGQTARMRRLILAFAVSIWSKTRFRVARPIWLKQSMATLFILF